MEPLRSFFNKENIPSAAWPQLSYIASNELPQPAAFLLTQALLTKGITEYYQRTPKIRAPIYIEDDIKNNHFSRAVLMVIDNDRNRDDALLADHKHESTVVELGLITIHFSALPNGVIAGVRKGDIPFGALLAEHKVNTQSINTHYFKIAGAKALATYLHCKPDEILYGRSNTLVRDDNQIPVAHVVEILSNKK